MDKVARVLVVKLVVRRRHDGGRSGVVRRSDELLLHSGVLRRFDGNVGIAVMRCADVRDTCIGSRAVRVNNGESAFRRIEARSLETGAV